MGANEIMVYAGSLIITVTLFGLGSGATEAFLDNAFQQMDYQQSRYESLVRSYDLVSNKYNYKLNYEKFDRSRSDNLVEGVSEDEHCEYVRGSTNFLLTNSSSLYVERNMKVYTLNRGSVDSSISPPYDCEGPPADLPASLSLSYPELSLSVDGSSNPGNIDTVTTVPNRRS